MNDYQKAIKRGIETGLDNHFSKKEPKKVWLTVDEAKRLHDCAMFFWDDYEGTKLFTYDDEQFLTEMKKRIEQAEGKQ